MNTKHVKMAPQSRPEKLQYLNIFSKNEKKLIYISLKWFQKTFQSFQKPFEFGYFSSKF